MTTLQEKPHQVFIWLKALALGLLRNALRYRLSKIGIDDNEAE
jgi:hypothetical protein